MGNITLPIGLPYSFYCKQAAHYKEEITATLVKDVEKTKDKQKIVVKENYEVKIKPAQGEAVHLAYECLTVLGKEAFNGLTVDQQNTVSDAMEYLTSSDPDSVKTGGGEDGKLGAALTQLATAREELKAAKAEITQLKK